MALSGRTGEIIKGDFVVAACRDRYDFVTDPKNHGFRKFDTEGMEDFFFEYVRESGVPCDSSPGEIVDHALLCGLFGELSDIGIDLEYFNKHKDEFLYTEIKGNKVYVIVSL